MLGEAAMYLKKPFWSNSARILPHNTLSLRGQPYQPFNHRATLLGEDITFPQETLSLRGQPYQPFNHRVTLQDEDITFPQETLSLRGQPYQP